MNIQGKVWGNTSSLFEKNNVEIHRIEAKMGSYCSRHKHEYKYNMFFLEAGEMQIEVWKNDYDLVDITTLFPGNSTTVSPGEYHIFRAIKDSICFEIYWVELSNKDIIRENVGGKLE
jgi:mannose-6-phosphate isomerase-like protein (cupin superfamily)